jgi:hypothetical protein
MFLFAMSDQFVVRRADRVRRYWRAFIYFTLPESEQPRTSVISSHDGQEDGHRTDTSDIVASPQ